MLFCLDHFIRKLCPVLEECVGGFLFLETSEHGNILGICCKVSGCPVNLRYQESILV